MRIYLKTLCIALLLMVSLQVAPQVFAQGTYSCYCRTVAAQSVLESQSCAVDYQISTCPQCGGFGPNNPFVEHIVLSCTPMDQDLVNPPAAGAGADSLNEQDPTSPISEQVLNDLNPIFTQNTEGPQIFTPGAITPAVILQRLMVFAFPIAGLILLVMLVWAGAEIIMGATDKKSLDAGKNRATAALIGFLLLFVSYWIVQLIEIVFNVSIISR